MVITPKDNSESIVKYVDDKIDYYCTMDEDWMGQGEKAEVVSDATAKCAKKEIRDRIEELRGKEVRHINVSLAQDGSVCFDFLFPKDEDEEGYCIYPEDFE